MSHATLQWTFSPAARSAHRWHKLLYAWHTGQVCAAAVLTTKEPTTRALRDCICQARDLLHRDAEEEEEEEEEEAHTAASTHVCTCCQAMCFGVVAQGPRNQLHCARCVQQDPDLHESWVGRVWAEELKRLGDALGKLRAGRRKL